MEKKRIDIDPEEDFFKFDKFFNAFLKFMMGTSVTTLVSMGLQLLHLSAIGWHIGAALICIPSTYVGMTVLKNRIDRKFKLDMSRADQLIKSLYEIGTYDKTIEKGKTFFWNEIELCSKKRDVRLASQDKNTINQLLFMINENYYDEISATMTISRDELVSKVIDVAVYYVENHGSISGDQAIEDIIGALFFVDKDMKKRMFNEFKAGKCIMDKQVDYRIVSKNVNINHLLSEDFTSIMNKERIPYFDFDDCKEYEHVMQILIQKEYFKDYGDPTSVDWNVPLLRDVMSMIILEFDEELKKECENYTPVDLATSFLYNVMLYCLLNGKKECGLYEIVNVFKNWNMLPFNLKLSIVNRIFDKYNLEMEHHPFGVKNTSRHDVNKKIIVFPSSPEN